MKISQKGFNYSQDGPGNRLVYHLQGCNFACKWCSNSDLIALENPSAVNYTLDEIENEITRSRMMFFDGGGVTFTGGEATLQADELLTLLKRLKAKGIHTCIETNGSNEKLILLSEFIDYLIIDLKHFDDEKHRFWTGCSNKATKKNIEYFLSIGKEIHIRIPLINGVNLDPEGFAQYFADFDTSKADFEFLPYHEFGKDKWRGKYEITDGFVSQQMVEKFEKTFEKHNLKTIKT